MSTRRIRTAQLIPNEREVPKDITQLVDTYVNYEYERVYRMMEEILEQIPSKIFKLDIKIHFDPEIVETLANYWINQFGTSYEDYIQYIDNEEFERRQGRGTNSFPIGRMDRNINELIFKSGYGVGISLPLEWIMAKYLVQWAHEEGYDNVNERNLRRYPQSSYKNDKI